MAMLSRVAMQLRTYHTLALTRNNGKAFKTVLKFELILLFVRLQARMRDRHRAASIDREGCAGIGIPIQERFV